MKNFELVRTFEDGYSTDLKDNLERKNTFQKGINGRLYEKNGTLAFNAIEGSKLVYTNNQLVKYLGFHSFRDEFLVFAKCLKTLNNDESTEEICSTTIVASNFLLSKRGDDLTPFDLSTEITDNTSIVENCYTVTNPLENEGDFQLNFSCGDLTTDLDIDFGEYFEENVNLPNLGACSINNNQIGIHNEVYDDCIYSFKLDDNYNLVGTLLWVGHQNWPFNSKITTEGVEENEFYKRVYYTDAFNPKRVVNIKDPSLINKSGNEFNQILNNVLLQPKVVEVSDGGQLPAMKSMYVYRVISNDGQLSEFSPSSFFANILMETEPIRYRGGDISENTGKSVKVKCNIINPIPNSEIECIALEYETYGAPTSIRNLGRKPTDSVVEFMHYGNESEFTDNITFGDIVDAKNTWKYCNDFTSKKNKLIAGGLRNDPIPSEINNLEYLFPLHSWKEDGTTHNCLMNPKPWEYRYIDPTNDSELVYIKQKIYETLSSFGPLTLSLKNVLTGEVISKSFTDINVQSYTNIISLVLEWLNEEQLDASFQTKFPNLSIVNYNNKILFKPADELIQTDLSNYVFESNNDQFIENFDNDIQFLDVSVDTSNFVYGAQSLGFNKGIGVRVTYREFKRPLLKKANAIYDGTGKLLDYMKPTEEKFCMKGEIYRIAFQAYDNDSTRYFSIPLGDLMIPNLGELVKEIDNNGNIILSSEKYVNQSVEGDTLYGHGIKMHIEVRLSCELQEKIPMYQILYVERTEENRTILCQGISAPLTRVQDTGSESHRMDSRVRNKWNLPYYGGPTYEQEGLSQYDIHGEDYNTQNEDSDSRVITHRGLMYFDSPDLYYRKISSQFVKTSSLDIIGKIKTDHTPNVIRERGGNMSGITSGIFGTLFGANFGNEIYPKFSRKILENQIEGNNHSGDLPRASNQDGNVGDTYESHFINVSVFSNYINYSKNIKIDKAEVLKRGEEISGSAFNLPNDISNNTHCLPSQPWYYGGFQRRWSFANNGGANSSIFRSGTISPGYETVIIKTTEDLFTREFHGSSLGPVHPQIRKSKDPRNALYDTLPVINLNKGNRESVYGGRTKEAFSQNTYIPMSETIPVIKSSNSAQSFDVGADIYVTLNIRTKNDYGDSDIFEDEMNNGSGRSRGDITVWRRNGAWVYVCVLETQVEPKWTYQYEFYRENSSHSFEAIRSEIINSAYFQENTLKSYAPKPFKYKDDPNQNNIIAVSDVKIAGELYDSWTSFKPNNFYDQLEKNKGAVTNLVKEKDKIFAIQEGQTSLIYIGTERLVQDSEGKTINLQQGSGTVVDGHEVISSYGTSIRRATVPNDDFGFCFFDEKKNEFVKTNKPLLISKLLHLEYNNRFKTNPVVDSETYFDHDKKETNICLKLKDGTGYILSYNEAKGVFNGEYQYNNDLYIMFDQKVFFPIRTENDKFFLSENMHQMNEGEILNLAGEQKLITIGLIVNSNIDKVFQYKQTGVIVDLPYKIKSFKYSSNLPGYDRTITEDHIAYKVREGTHTVPAINENLEFLNNSDLRGNQIYIEITVESKDNNKVSILAILNSLRFSHQ